MATLQVDFHSMRVSNVVAVDFNPPLAPFDSEFLSAGGRRDLRFSPHTHVFLHTYYKEIYIRFCLHTQPLGGSADQQTRPAPHALREPVHRQQPILHASVQRGEQAGGGVEPCFEFL